MQVRSDFGDQTFPNLNFAASCVRQAWALESLPAHGGYVSRPFWKNVTYVKIAGEGNSMIECERMQP